VDVGDQIQASQHGFIPQKSLGLVRLRRKSTQKVLDIKEEKEQSISEQVIRLCLSSHTARFRPLSASFIEVSDFSIIWLCFLVHLILLHWDGALNSSCLLGFLRKRAISVFVFVLFFLTRRFSPCFSIRKTSPPA
jgi:hypothetical protein